MNPLSWNCRGLGTPRLVRALHDLVKRYNPEIVFLLETKSKTRRMERIKNRIGFALLWSREIDLEIMSYTKNHIDVVIKETNSDFKWRFNGFYGHPETHKRCESWNLLAFLNSQYHLPWLCLGDFNEILSMDEKFGG